MVFFLFVKCGTTSKNKGIRVYGFMQNKKIQTLIIIFSITILTIIIIILCNVELKINNEFIINYNVNNKQEERNSINLDENFQDEIENIIFNLINEERLKNNLEVSSIINIWNVMVEKAKDMLVNDYYSNEDPEGKYIVDCLIKDGIVYTHVGENISYSKDAIYNSNNEFAEGFVSILMHQVDESDNILDPVLKN